MSMDGIAREIETGKRSVLRLFREFWFRVPSYQRPYVWKDEQIDELFEDIWFAVEHSRDKEYFLGSAVLQKTKITQGKVTFDCCDILDGQQRLTTLLLLMAVLRDTAIDPNLRETTGTAILQAENAYENRPERTRIEFEIRDEVSHFIDQFVKRPGATKESEQFRRASENGNASVANMANAVLCLKGHIEGLPADALARFATYLLQKVIFIYVATEELDDAFRLFTILNDRGMPLTTGDVLKSMSIGAVVEDDRKKSYAREWEEMEDYFGRDDFDRFLNHVRTILLKDKPRENLLKEWELIYSKGLLVRGRPTLDLLRSYREHYARLIELEDAGLPIPTANLIAVMKVGLATDWVPPLLRFYEKFRADGLHEFLVRLASKFAADWILRESPGTRLSNMYAVVRAIEKEAGAGAVVSNSDLFSYDRDELRTRLNGDVYHERYAKHLLLMVEYLLGSPNQVFPRFGRVSVEHVLPQNPPGDSPWHSAFSPDERKVWTHKLANLVLLSRNKNAALGNRSFEEKKKRYFQSSVEVFPAIGRVLQLPEWNPAVLEQIQKGNVDLLMKGFK